MSDKRKSKYIEKPNRFTIFRTNRKDLHQPIKTIPELSDEIGVSAGEIHKLEKMDCNIGEAPHCYADILKRYHDATHCSYEYLMGEEYQPERTNFSVDPILGQFNKSFWENIKTLIQDDDDPTKINEERFTILVTLMNNPHILGTMMDDLFHSMNTTYNIKENYGNPNQENKDYQIAVNEYATNKILTDFMNKYLLNSLIPLFKKKNESVRKVIKSIKKEKI